MYKLLRKKVDQYNQVLEEGTYRAKPMTLMSLVRGLQPDLRLPETTEAAFGTQIIEQGKSLGSKFLWGSALLLASMGALMWGALALGTAGIAIYALEYRHAKRARENLIAEINFAGQRVQGRRADLCQLHRAQLRIMNISSSLDASSAATTNDAVNAILESVKDARSRVKILDGGRLGAGKEAYGFSEPDFHLFGQAEPQPVQLPEPGSLRAAWAGKKLTPDEVVDSIVALHEALPSDLARRVNERLQARPVNADVAAPAAEKIPEPKIPGPKTPDLGA
jgi:hypothetical protein